MHVRNPEEAEPMGLWAQELESKTELAIKVKNLSTSDSFENWNIKKMNLSEWGGRRV